MRKRTPRAAGVNRTILKEALKVTLPYLVFGVLWITLSGYLAELFTPDVDTYRYAELFKGLVFILLDRKSVV